MKANAVLGACTVLGNKSKWLVGINYFWYSFGEGVGTYTPPPSRLP